MDVDIQFMQEALAEARSAAEAGEVPVGALLVHDGKILSRSGNRTMRDLLDEQATATPDKVFLIFEDASGQVEEFNYQCFVDAVDAAFGTFRTNRNTTCAPTSITIAP